MQNYQKSLPHELELIGAASLRALELDAALQAIFDEEQFAKTIFHYCSIQTAHKIVASSEFWMTDFRSLNDRSEVSHGLQLFKEQLCDSPLLTSRALRFNLVPILIEAMEQTSAPNVFVTSFSANGDLKSQWAEYGDSFEGCAIGIETEAICHGIHSDALIAVGEAGPIFPRIRCVNAIYDENEKRASIDRALAIWLPSIIEYFDRKILFGDVRNYLLASFSGGIHQVFSKLKNPACFEEKEVRITATTVSNHKTRQFGWAGIRKPFSRDGKLSISLIHLHEAGLAKTRWLQFPLSEEVSGLKSQLEPSHIIFGPRAKGSEAECLKKRLSEIGGTQFGESSVPY